MLIVLEEVWKMNNFKVFLESLVLLISQMLIIIIEVTFLNLSDYFP